MDKAESLQLLREKVELNYQDFYDEWMELHPSSLIAGAQHIAVVTQTYRWLRDDSLHVDESLEHLLRFENPLELVSDDISALSSVAKEDVEHSIWCICRDLHPDYEMDTEEGQPDPEDEMEV